MPNRSNRPLLRIALILGVLCAGASTSLTAASAANLAEVLERFDEVQASIRTLSAEFTETTHNPMLRDPIVSAGQFFMTKPDAIRWEYSAPEEMRFVIANDEYTGYFPAQKRAEQRSIKRWSEHLFRFFGLGQGSDELSKFYEITLIDDAAAADGYHLLLLEPRKKRARKRVAEVRFWLDTESYLPRRVEYRSKDGAARRIEFTDIGLNPDLAASLYTVEIPADVTVTKGFSGLPNLDPGAVQ